ncbi:hypothetical protein HYPSUDRAFT_909407 [Hypholoma sublateritium FD-334 SS-4]|uniref:Uncharacterized protein n=1 Tax=Hypholoma sublateritium (strain FD-334 SS-4) TaxID=945553 RepID=A0A0D2NQI0_HYPSF|nr:hypothetical protein HYPSUDRAFT_909407 [Hypholoma sublateritium FD-334 SS-4]
MSSQPGPAPCTCHGQRPPHSRPAFYRWPIFHSGQAPQEMLTGRAAWDAVGTVRRESRPRFCETSATPEDDAITPVRATNLRHTYLVEQDLLLALYMPLEYCPLYGHVDTAYISPTSGARSPPNPASIAIADNAAQDSVTRLGDSRAVKRRLWPSKTSPLLYTLLKHYTRFIIDFGEYTSSGAAAARGA